MFLYEGAKDEPLLQAARTSIRGRAINAGIVIVGALVVRYALGLRPAADLALLFSGYFMANLGFAAMVPRLRRQGRLEGALTISVAAGAPVIAAGCWISGGAEWLGMVGLFMNILLASYTLRLRSARKVYVVSLTCFVLLLALSYGGVGPAEAMLPPLLSNVDPAHRLAAYAAFGMVFVMLCLSTGFLSAAQERREKTLRAANLRLSDLNGELRDKHFTLLCSQQDLILANEKLRLKSDEVLKSADVIAALAAAVEAKDNYTEGHSSRVAEAAVWLAREIGLNAEEQGMIRHACYLHDIGKINISDLILKKAGPLSREEFEQMKRHPLIGEQIVRPLAFARPFLDVIRHHHERMDGAGYPDGLKGEEISLPARIAAIADAWDAMTSDRPYRAALSDETAFARLREGAGKQWDANLVDSFVAMMQRRNSQTHAEARHA